jgi:hypothetical protein
MRVGAARQRSSRNLGRGGVAQRRARGLVALVAVLVAAGCSATPPRQDARASAASTPVDATAPPSDPPSPAPDPTVDDAVVAVGLAAVAVAEGSAAGDIDDKTADRLTSDLEKLLDAVETGDGPDVRKRAAKLIVDVDKHTDNGRLAPSRADELRNALADLLR